MTTSERLFSGLRMFVAGALALAVAAFPLACSREGKGSQAAAAKGPRAVLVTTAAATTRDVPVEITDLIGTVSACNSVTVQAEVGGKLLEALVKKGDAVKQGDLLFKIDPEPYRLALEQANATYAKDKAQADFAKLTAQRIEALFATHVTGQDELDQSKANAQAMVATLQVDQSAIDNAKLNLRRTEIRSPIAGRVGTVISAGNAIKANDTVLLTINQVSPIDVFFTIPQASLPAVQRQMAKGKLAAKAYLDDATEAPAAGELTFIDNSADQESLMVRLGATFANEDGRLWPPGQGIKVTLRLSDRPRLVVVLAKAVQNGRDGKYVFVVKSDQSVEQRDVTVGQQVGDDIVIEKGLRAGEIVVTDGQFQLTPGAKVQLKGADGEGRRGNGGSGGRPSSGPAASMPSSRPDKAEAVR